MIVSLHEITANTVREITNLSVSPEQQRFVASNAVSLAQALFSPDAWYRAIYADDTPAGFVMLYDESLRTNPPARPEVAIYVLASSTRGRSITAKSFSSFH
jgi:diamine N-acetyltransferase